MNKNKLLYFTIALTALITIFTTSLGCCSYNKNILEEKIKFNNYQKTLKQSSNTPALNENFIYLTRIVAGSNDTERICQKEEDYKDCETLIAPLTSASGYIFKVDKKNYKLYALTAGHWCHDLNKDNVSETFRHNLDYEPMTRNIASFMGYQHDIQDIYMDMENDICIITFNSEHAGEAKNVKFAKRNPLIGEKVYAISSPEWHYSKSVRNHFEGRFSGCDIYECFYTIPATFGSSGSAVINEKGEIISIITKASIDFNNISFGPRLKYLKSFVKLKL